MTCNEHYSESNQEPFCLETLLKWIRCDWIGHTTQGSTIAEFLRFDQIWNVVLYGGGCEQGVACSQEWTKKHKTSFIVKNNNTIIKHKTM
jgi:hypothetical protein